LVKVEAASPAEAYVPLDCSIITDSFCQSLPPSVYIFNYENDSTHQDRIMAEFQFLDLHVTECMGRLTSPMELVIIIGSRTTRSVEINLID
jgi:hypothetical protein